MRTPDSCCQDHLDFAPRSDTLLDRVANYGYALVERLAAIRRVAHQRRDLRDLDDRTLCDIGVSRAEVERESGRHFWDIDT